VQLLTDPLLQRRVGHLLRASPLDPLTPSPHVVLISHGHHDHLHSPSLRLLGRAFRVVAPRGLGPWLKDFDVVEVEEGDEAVFGPVTVRALHAEHEGGRPLRGRGTALGYAILGSRRVYFAGDTDLFDAMEGLVPDLDLALVPVWGWGATLGRGKHLDPERAAEAMRRLRPRIAIPIHWGTYRPLHRSARARFLTEPAQAFAEAAARTAPDVAVHILHPGESLSV
jgi:L-ascorbate metabolism protein UlaG (beta-lactamase superfamily)